MTYIANNTLTNMKTGRTFMPGDKVAKKDFPASAIKQWLASGDLLEDPAKVKVIIEDKEVTNGESREEQDS